MSDLSLVNNLVEYLKLIMTNCVIKNPKHVNNNENELSIKFSSFYLSALKGTSRFETFKSGYTYKDFHEALKNLYDANEVINLFNNQNKLSDNEKKIIHDYYKNKIINNYIEVNEYYRELNGDCDRKSDNIVILTKEDVGDLISDIDISIPVHKMDTATQDLLYSFNIIDDIKEKYPYNYLNYLGSRKKSIFQLRTLEDFSLISIDAEVPDEIKRRFSETYELNRKYILHTLYKDAFKLDNEYFDEFIILLILVQTSCDILADVADIINKRELFDLKTIKVFFNSIGVEYFSNIPYKYQMDMVRNFHLLLLNKSTTKSIIDILNIFKMKNIEIFNYYLCKRRKLDRDKNFIDTGDVNEDFELKFLKCPVDSNPDDYIHYPENFVDYDDIVDSDEYWKGDLDKEDNDKRHMDLEFNYIPSKYLSIDVMNDINEINMQLIFFYNMLYDSKVLEENLKLSIPFLDNTHKFKLVDVFSYLTSLTYLYNGLVDKTTKLPEQALFVKGFNFETDLDDITNFLNENKMTWKDLGITEFINPDYEFIKPEQFVEVLNNNTLVLSELVNLINNCENKKMYDILNKIYESLFYMELNDKFYMNTIKKYPESNKEFIKERDLILYTSLENLSTIDDKSALQEQISLIIEYVVYSLQNYITTLDFTYILKDIPTVSSEAIQEYLIYVINFFKSFKTQILNINSKFHFNDLYENKINLIDDFKYQVIINFFDSNKLLDKIKLEITRYQKDKVITDEKIYFEYILSIIEKYYENSIKIEEKLHKYVSIKSDDSINIKETVTITEVEK